MGCPGGTNLKQLLADGISSSLVPVFTGNRLLRSPNLDPASMKPVKLVRLGNVAVQGNRIKLSQDGNPEDAGINAVADWNVYQAVFPGNGNGRLGAHFCQGKQAGAPPSAQDDSQNILHG